MSQDRVLDWLKKKHPKKYSVRELQDRLGINQQTIYQNLWKLMNFDFVCSEEKIFPDKRHTYTVFWFNPDPKKKKKIQTEVVMRPLKDMVEIGVLQNIKLIHCLRYLNLVEQLNIQFQNILNNIEVVKETREGILYSEWKSFEGKKSVANIIKEINEKISALKEVKV